MARKQPNTNGTKPLNTESGGTRAVKSNKNNNNNGNSKPN